MSGSRIAEFLELWRNHGASLHHRGRRVARRIALLLAVVGPGLITSNVDNDAGGILVYSQAGAQFGYLVLWGLVPMTFILFVTEEMCARMGAVTGKGLSDLIREEFGFRITFFVLFAVLITNLGNVLAEFAGVASALEIFGVSRYISVPVAALIAGTVVLGNSYQRLEKIFLVGCLFYVAYIFSAILAKPDWLVAARHTVVPTLSFDPAYLLIMAALVGATIAPWQHFYLQAAVVEKRVGPRQYQQARTDVLVGSVTCMVIVFFIIVSCAATLHVAGIRDLRDAGQAAQALVPLAGKYAAFLFAFGLANASLFAACILPLSTSFVICEGLGFESGVDRKLSEAPFFYGLFIGLIAIGALPILLPSAPLVTILILSQVANAVLLPFVLFFIVILASRRDLMGDRVNTRTQSTVAWVTSVVTVAITLLVLATSLLRPGNGPLGP